MSCQNVLSLHAFLLVPAGTFSQLKSSPEAMVSFKQAAVLSALFAASGSLQGVCILLESLS